MSSTLFLGYADAAEFARNCAGIEPVNVLRTVTHAPAGGHLARETAHLVLSQLRGDTVHYCRIPLGARLVSGSTPMSESPAFEDSDRAEQIAVKKLSNRWTVRKALPAWSKDLVLLEGRADWLTFDAEKNQWRGR